LIPFVALASLSDAQLVARCRAGENEAWNELVTRFSRYVYGIAIQAFRLSEHDAEDVFQDCFARVYEHLDKLRDDSALRPWIGQLTRRLCVDKLRGSSREQPTAEENLPTGVDDTIGTLDEAMAVHEALAVLSGDCREILDRFFAQDQSYRTIADALELPAGTIASRISRCLKKLRVQLQGKNQGGSSV
jgi:RNA polymerase sigma factor (sigma-70 family)